MLFTTAFIALAAPFLTSAAPVRRDASANDILVLQFADVLEQLESQFYQQALSKFQVSDFEEAGFISSQVPLEQFKVIQSDEETHSTTIRAVLQSFGKSPIDTCQFNFDPALTDVATMAATARVVENVGVGAYLGGATLIDDPVLLDAAASILTVEARHQTVLNILSGASAVPSAFDIPLTPSEVLALAGPFISGCDVGISAAVSLVITNTGTVAPGTTLTFEAASINGTTSEDQLFCQMMLGGAAASLAFPIDECVVPDNINGPVAIWITSDNQPLVNNVRDRATTQQVAGPAMAFIDTVSEELGQLVICDGEDSGSHKGSGSHKDSSSHNSSSHDSSSHDSSSDDGYGSYDGSSDNNSTYGSNDGSNDTSISGSSSDGSNGGSSDPAQTDSTTTVISLDQASAIVASASPTASAASGSSTAIALNAPAATPAAAAAAVAPSSAQSNTASTPGGPNLQTGKSADGSLNVIGWSNLPAPGSAPAAASSAPAAPLSGGYGGY